MKYILHVDNSETARIGVRSLVRWVNLDLRLLEERDIASAKLAINTIGASRIHLAVLDWSLPDGRARVLLPLLTSSRVVILSAKAPVVPGVVVIPKEGDWWRLLETELRK